MCSCRKSGQTRARSIGARTLALLARPRPRASARLDPDLRHRRVRRFALGVVQAFEAAFVEHERRGLLVLVTAALDAYADRNAVAARRIDEANAGRRLRPVENGDGLHRVVEATEHWREVV